MLRGKAIKRSKSKISPQREFILEYSSWVLFLLYLSTNCIPLLMPLMWVISLGMEEIFVFSSNNFISTFISTNLTLVVSSTSCNSPYNKVGIFMYQLHDRYYVVYEPIILLYVFILISINFYSLSFLSDVYNEVHERMQQLSELWWDQNTVIILF